MCDVLIVGAGIAGSMAAYLLQSRGKDVVLIDDKEFPVVKHSSGVVTRRVLNLLDDMSLTVGSQVNKVDIRDRRDNLLSEVRLDSSIYNIDTTDLLLEIRNKFLDRGGILLEDTKLHSYNSVTKVARCIGNVLTINFDTIIGADGVLSKVREQLDKDYKPAGAISTRDEITRKFDVIEVQRRSQSGGYFISIPRIVLNGDNAKIKAAGISICEAEDFERVLSSLINYEMYSQVHSGYIPYGARPAKVCDYNVFLIGEAAGLGDALLGHGIYYALKSAKEVTNAIMCTGASQKYYKTEVKAMYKEIDSQLFARKFLKRVGGIDFVKSTKKVDRLFARLVTRYIDTGMISRKELIELYTINKLATKRMG